MAKKMLIDATHAEETRVVVVDGNKVEEFDFESENKRQLAGNIYLAKVTRVEPSLQAAFVDYGGNRHGFLAFSEIHPDYYQIPVADRQALMEEEAALAAEDDDENDKEKSRSRSSKSRSRRSRSRSKAETAGNDDKTASADVSEIKGMETIDLETEGAGDTPLDVVEDTIAAGAADAPVADPAPANDSDAGTETAPAAEAQPAARDVSDEGDDCDDDDGDSDPRDDSIESVADDDTEEEIRPRRKPRARKYKIQEVIKVRQIMLVQVVKEERGNKGAALTTYLSLAGRYCVLMPNTARGGGISRKITNATDRSKLKQIAQEIDVPKGAGLIIRTAGAKRTKTEIKRDYEYLQRLWEQIRELTLKSVAPAKIYEEGDLIKRSIRDLYNREIDEVHVEGEKGYRIAKDFMKMIMPSHAKNVKHYVDPMPLFARYQVESYLSSMFNPTVQLKSGGYIVIGVTEALVAIDVNSGRATKEGSIEETALKTNLEAAEEVARQLRLRDLAGLIVIDFIDMDERKNNTAVEKKLKDKLKTDRARIQVGRISGFGLLEMSRQRLRPGMIEATTQPCPACHGTGLIRSDDNMALNILRQIEEEGTRRRSREVLVKCPVGIANYLMNQKREHVAMIEARYGMAVRIEGDTALVSPDFTMEKFKTATRNVPEVVAPVVSVDTSLMDQIDEDSAEAEEVDPEEAPAPVAEAAAPAPEAEGEDEGKPKKRRRRRRRSRSKNKDNGENGQNGDDSAPNGEDKGSEDKTEQAPAETAKDKGETPAEPVAAAADAPVEASSDASGEAPAAEEEAPAKPKRSRSRSRSRKPAKAETEAATENASDAPAADAAPASAVEETAAPVAEPTAEVVPEAPAAEVSEAPEPEAEPEPAPVADPEPEAAEEVAAPAAEAPAVEPAPEAEAPAVEPASEDAPAEPEAAAPAEEAEEPAETPQPAEEATESAPAPEEERQPEPVAETAGEDKDDGKPKRRGWWSVGL
ncbi:MAG: ribonuclease [Rhodobacteraceae bacterium]|jgi:ribonuclease E|uniref:Ribonuclease E n=1 Tax=Salipiger profundus TaxID=1229727 RepID=A0A1U7D882_9RHOB|nr:MULTISPECIES: ribonuclease E/G [Salipiger]APX24333.1 RNAse E [Salipiger profundus]MAB06661.1 ribonuclease [Paracoccaceae bacterium]SFB83593.1 RNAse E [Salipiger profundus]